MRRKTVAKAWSGGSDMRMSDRLLTFIRPIKGSTAGSTANISKPRTGSDAQLAYVSHGDIVFDLRSATASMSQTLQDLQVVLSSGYDFGHHD